MAATFTSLHLSQTSPDDMSAPVYDQPLLLNSYPVLDSVAALLGNIGDELSRTNAITHSAFRIVSRARDIYMGIHELIRVIEIAERWSEDHWDTFTRYTLSIEYLEE